jgi:hypothetical protein
MSKEKKRPNKALQFAGAGFQIGATIWLFSKLGEYLHTVDWFAAEWSKEIFTLFGVFIAMYNLIRQLSKLNE